MKLENIDEYLIYGSWICYFLWFILLVVWSQTNTSTNIYKYTIKSHQDEKKYTYDFEIGGTKLTEEVIMGGMKNYMLLSLLQRLNNRETNLDKLEYRSIDFHIEKYFNMNY